MAGFSVQNMLVNLARMLYLRSGPQHLPASKSLAVFLLAAYVAQNLLTGQQLADDYAAEKSLVAITLQIVILTGLLRWRNFQERFVQTLTALVGVGIFFNAIIWALLTQSDPDLSQPGLALAWFGVFFWSLFVDASIYRHSLAVSLAVGMLITVLMLAMSYIFIDMLFLVEQ
jgi:hypothetical protein